MAQSPARVLIVDDDRSNRALLTRMLEAEFDVAIVHAANGLEALDVLTREPVALMLLDARMPIMDGVETLEMIRRSPDLGSLPVCMMTVDRREALVLRAVELGVADFVLKPLNPRVALPRIRRLLALSQEARSAGAATFRLASTSHVLIVDGQDEFRAFFSDHVKRRCSVDAVANGIDALRACLQRAPAAVFVGDSIGLLDRDHLARKIRDLESCRGSLLIAIADEEGAAAPAGYDGVLVRSLHDETFWSRFFSAVRSDDAAALSEASAPVRSAITALTQSCRLALDLDLDPAARRADPQRRDWCGARAQLVGANVVLELEFAMPAIVVRFGLGRRSGAASGHVVFGQEDVAAAVTEIAMAAANRFISALAEHGTFVRIEESAALPASAIEHGWSATGDQPGALCVGFVARDGQLCATLTLTQTARHPAAAAPAAPHDTSVITQE